MKSLFATSLLLGLIATGAVGGEHKPCSATADYCLKEMKQHYQSTGWVGISVEQSKEGQLKVLHVWPESPAHKAGLRKNDVLMAFEGVAFLRENAPRLKKLYKKHKIPGQEVTYLVHRGEKNFDIQVRLTTVPSEVVRRTIGGHMLDGHAGEARSGDTRDP